MSEDKKKNDKETETEETIVETNVALIIAERDSLLEIVKDKDELIVELTKQLSAATALIEEDSKAALVNEIAPKTHVPKSILSVMKIDELQKWKKVLDSAKVISFKSGTPKAPARDSAQAKLDSMYETFMEKHVRKN